MKWSDSDSENKQNHPDKVMLFALVILGIVSLCAILLLYPK